MEWLVGGGVAVVLGLAALLLNRRTNRNLGEALGRIEIRDEQIASLLDQNQALRAAIENPVERQQSAVDDLRRRGLRPDGTPITDPD